MECRSIRRTLPALLDGDLRPEPEAVVRRHLEQCPACTAELEEMRDVLRESDEALAYAGPALSFDDLRARMATVEPIDQVLRYKLPKLRIPGAAPRFAVAMIMLVFVAGLPYAFRHTKQVYTSVRTPFSQQEATLLAALEDGQFPGEAGRDDWLA